MFGVSTKCLRCFSISLARNDESKDNTAPVVNVVIAMMSGASNSPSPSALELATRTHRSVFFWYMCWLAVAAIVTLFFTWALWKSSNRRQEAANAEAEARALKLEAAASDSKAAQQQVETDLSRAKEAQAVAEKSLLEIQNLVRAPRTIDRKRAREILEAGPKGSVKILYTDGSQEAFDLAYSLYSILTSSGWAASIPDWAEGGIPFTGILIELGGAGWVGENPSDSMEAPEPAKTLRIMLFEAVNHNGGVTMRANQELAADALVIMVGPKY